MDKYYTAGWLGVAMIVGVVFVFFGVLISVAVLGGTLVIYSWYQDIDW